MVLLRCKVSVMKNWGFFVAGIVPTINAAMLKPSTRDMRLGSDSGVLETNGSRDPTILVDEKQGEILKASSTIGSSLDSKREDVQGTSELLKNLKSSYSAKSKMFDACLVGFSELSSQLTDERREIFLAHQEDVRTAIESLYEPRIRGLLGPPADHFQATLTPVLQDTNQDIPKRSPHAWLDTFSKMAETEEDCLKDRIGPKERLFKNGWNDLMIDLFIDLHKYQLIPPSDLSKFLNEQDQGKLILSYFLNRFSLFDENAVYLNFNFKLTFQENPFNKPLADFSLLIEEKIWKRIEFGYLKAWISSYRKNRSAAPLIESLAEEFLEIASPENESNTLLVTRTEAYSERLLDFIAVRPQPKNILNSFYTIESKLLFDMINYIMRYCRQNISLGFFKTLESSLAYNHLVALDTSITFLSVTTNLAYLRAKELLANVKEDSGERMDSTTLAQPPRGRRLPEFLIRQWSGAEYLAGPYDILKLSDYSVSKILHDVLNSWDYELIPGHIKYEAPSRRDLLKKSKMVDGALEAASLQARMISREDAILKYGSALVSKENRPGYISSCLYSGLFKMSFWERYTYKILMDYKDSFTLIGN